MRVQDVQALVFDVLGTVVDEAGSLRRQVHEVLRRRGAEAGAALDRADGRLTDVAGDLTRAWEEHLDVLMGRVRTGQAPFERQGQLRRRALADVLAQPAFGALPPAVGDDLAEAGAHLAPWPDSPGALGALASGYTLVALSNADLADLAAFSAAGGLRWHATLSTELIGAFKPAPATYAMVENLLGLDPAGALMVAAHPWDLRAAAAAGLRTAYIARPGEGQPDPQDRFDLRAGDLTDLAAQLLETDRR